MGYQPSYFYPRSPCGERHIDGLHNIARPKISIHALLAESDSVTTSFQGGFAISIHALLAESDWSYNLCSNDPRISIHALLAESDECHRLGYLQDIPFLSTLSLRRATANEALLKVEKVISIHALLAESDGRY